MYEHLQLIRVPHTASFRVGILLMDAHAVLNFALEGGYPTLDF